jgi:hypothetical protein
MKRIKQAIVTLALLVGAVGVLAPSATAGAINVFDPSATNSACSNANASSAVCQSSKKDNVKDIVAKVINILLYILGAVAVIMIIIGGFMYAVSGGDATAVTKAKNTILYSVVGLVIAILAYAIVQFVIGAIK